MRRRSLMALTCGGLLLASLAACSGDEPADPEASDDPSASPVLGEPWILGTTEPVTSLDPAGADDLASWNLQYAIYEQLVTTSSGGGGPVGDAAESCAYEDEQTVTCTLRPDLEFSNGNALTSSDVRFSLERVVTISDPGGAGDLLTPLTDTSGRLRPGAIETPDDTTVIFHLQTPDQTWIDVLTTAVTSIVDEEVFAADELVADQAVVGSGPFELAEYAPGEQVVLQANPSYTGDRVPQADEVYVQYFSDSSVLAQAIGSRQVDVAWRSLGAEDLGTIADSGDAEVVESEGDGTELHAWVFQLGNAATQDVAVRQAVAQLVDREAIGAEVFDDYGDAAFTLVPNDYPGHRPSFEERYGDPDVEAARELLEDADVQLPVGLTLGYPASDDSPTFEDEAEALSSQLDGSELFTTTLAPADPAEFERLAAQGSYDLFQVHQSPVVPQAVTFLDPFLGSGTSEAGVDQLRTETDGETRESLTGELQDLVAEEVPVVPIWFGQNLAVIGPGMEGVEGALDPRHQLRLWEVSGTG